MGKSNVPADDEKLEEEENAFMNQFTETHAPESLKSLDKKMDEMCGDIALLLDSRKKDFQNTPGRKDRLPIMPQLDFFDFYKDYRKEKLDAALRVQIPSKRQSSSAVISKQVF